MAESPLFFSNENYRLFGVFHEPECENPTKAMIFCHPFAEEKLWSHRVYVSFARKLAELGWVVLRFDCMGFGDSEGEFTDSTVESYLDDISCANTTLRQKYPQILNIGLLGLRFGATLAYLWTSKNSITGPLILWEPIVDGDRYIQEALRSNLTTQLAVYGEVKETREMLVEKMKGGETVNVDGYDLHDTLFTQISNVNLLELPVVENPQLIVKITKGRRAGKDLVALADRARDGVLEFAAEDTFWREIKPFYGRAKLLFDVTTAWLEPKYE
ncbi:MAG: alpha/beta hydrolase [Candidatus Thiodiazotropha sp.]